MMPPSIYSFIKSEESSFETEKIRIGDNWEWNFRDHVQLLFHLKNGVFYTGENEYLRAFKNIIDPILNLAYWTEDIELKDVLFFIESEDGRALSFLIKKYHDEVYVKEHNLDTLFDEITESDVDYGGVLVQKNPKKKLEVIPLNTIAFCDQTDILGSPIGFKFYFSPSKLKQLSKVGWGSEASGATISVDDLIMLASNEKSVAGLRSEDTNRVPGKVIETYIVRGSLPEAYLLDNDNMEDYVEQLQIVAFYTDKDSKKQGVTLYRKKDNNYSLKFHTSKKVHGRALGRGVGEGLIHPQIWTNFLEIHKHNLIEAASKVPLYTDDPNYTNRNRIQEMENLEITVTEEGKRIYQVPTAAPANIQLISGSIDQWYQQAQLSGSAFDPIMGKEASSGTTFRGQERVVAQAKGSHDRRRGQRAKFNEELYRDCIIPDIKNEIVGGKKFLASLTSDEVMWITEQLAENYANSKQIEDLFNAKIPQEKEELKQEFITKFQKKGDKFLLNILADEFRDVEIKIGINVAGKQKDLAMLSDKLLSIFQFIFANPAQFQQAMKIPALSKSFSDILEFSGLSIKDFSSLVNTPIEQSAEPQQAPQELQLNQPVNA